MQVEIKRVLIAIGLSTSVAAGCAGTQKLGQTSGVEASGDEAEDSRAVTGASDPLAAGAKAVSGGAPKRSVTTDQSEDFAKAVARWHKAQREGTLQGECSSIAGAFASIADENPAIVEARGNQAKVLSECGRDAEAMQIWERLAQGPKPYAPALAQLGYAAWRAGDLARAETLFQRAIDSDKQLGSMAAGLSLAQLLREKARTAQGVEERNRYNREATEHVRRVMAVDANNLKAYAALCYFYYDLDLLEMARLVGNQAIWRAEEIATGKIAGQRQRLAENERPAPRGRGKKGQAAQEEEPAGRQLTAVGTGYTPEMKKALGMVHNTLGLVWLKRKNVTQAIASFRKAVDSDPDLHEARLNLAALSLNFRDYNTAEQNFRAVLKAQPKNYDAAIGLGVALRGQRKFDEAEQQYLAAQQLDQQNPESYFNLGVLYQEYKGIEKPNLIKAQQLYRDFLSRNRGNNAKKREAEKRIKDIDDTMAALDEAAKLQKEFEELQKKQEEQQKKMEEELKKMQEQEKAQQQPAAAPASTAPAAPPAAKGAS